MKSKDHTGSRFKVILTALGYFYTMNDVLFDLDSPTNIVNNFGVQLCLTN